MEMTTEAFEKEYGRLNPAQREAVDTIEGPVMVVAGPGTGKTQILTLRIANILLKTQTSPENVLALTFTESGASAMRSRLFEIAGSPAYRVPVYTFHGFCNEIIRRFPEFFPRVVGGQNITEVEQAQILERLLSNTEGIEKLRPAGNPTHYLHAIRGRIGSLKREGISAEFFAELVRKERQDFDAIPDLYHEKGIHTGKMKGEHKRAEGMLKNNEELSLLYQAYEASLATEHLYDFEDMIMEVSRAAEESPDLLLMLQEEYQYILVDEYQDTNRAQNAVVSLLMNFHENPNLFVVGDMKQAIFRFQGASEANFAQFAESYPQAKRIVLTDNYRSTQMILDAAWSVIPKEKLSAKSGHEERPISVYECASPETEEFFVADMIEKKIAEGVKPESIAVFYRDNRDAKGISRALGKRGIPYMIQGEEDAFSDLEIRKLLAFFRAVEGFGSEELFVEALHADFLRIPPLAVYELLAYAKKHRMTVFHALEDHEFTGRLPEDSRNALLRAFGVFKRAAVKAKNESFFDFFDFAIRESGFLAHLTALPDSILRVESLVALFEAAREFAARKESFMLTDFIGFADSVRDHGIRIKRKTGLSRRDAVALMTAHKSKGMEFDYTYLIGVADGHWGGRGMREKLELIPRAYAVFSERAERDEEEDERRLFFVALTRARKHATITYPKAKADGTVLFPSRFLGEISPGCVERKTAEEFESNLSLHKEQLFAEGKVRVFDVKTREFVSELFDAHGLSVTALNNYLSCPWKYFYVNLLRIPRVQEPHQMFGTAVHAALRDFFDAKKTRDADAEFIKESFRLHLRRQELSERDFAEFFARGVTALTGYVAAHAGRIGIPGKNEFEIGKVMLPNPGGEAIPLNGKIDRMEFLDDGGRVRVIDYKTGRPKSRNQILGGTKGSEGDIFRQLAFYKLLLSLYDTGAYEAVSGVIDFVEPTESGKYRSEEFELAEKEVEALAEEVRKAAGEIRSLAFWNSFCGEESCEYCAIRKMMEGVSRGG